ncbi:hypothetical protein THRCLA_01414 [Thraustotheca clavata]|uniref:Hsp70-Hsp90 organising protein n=1 Tax=Thraustotheca clavata TaxID=74557 RepID=A0A1W0A8C1_9STRA|nr:hypothetical protein THRCLA_01414 [Thraustotheca clavata]
MSSEAEQWKAKGNAALSAKNNKEAIECYTNAIALNGSNHVYYSNRSAAYLSNNQAELALKDAESCIGVKPDWGKGYARKGAALHALRDYDAAIAAYKDGLKHEPNNATCLSGIEDVEKDKANSADPLAGAFGPDMFAKLAMNPRVRHFLNDPEFVAKLQQVQQNPRKLNEYMNDQRMMTVLGELLGIGGMMNRDDEPEAPPTPAETPKPTPPAPEPVVVEEDLTDEEKAVRVSKKAAEECKARGNTFYKQKQFTEAIKAYEEAIAKDPTNMSYLSNLAAVRMELKEFDACIEQCKKAIEVGREHRADYALVAKAYVRIATAYIKMGESEENLNAAIEAFENAQVENRTKDVEKKLKDTTLKLKKVKELAYQDPVKGLEAKNEGNEFFKNGEFPKAVERYSEAIKRDPTNPVYYANRAAALTKLTSFPDAKADCEKALALDPNYVKAYSRLGAIQFFMKEYHKAMESYQKGLDIEPNNQECKDGLLSVQAKIQMGGNDSERAAHGMADPEIQAILRDPIMQQVLNDFQTDPRAAQRHLQNPGVMAKIEKLIAAVTDVPTLTPEPSLTTAVPDTTVPARTTKTPTTTIVTSVPTSSVVVTTRTPVPSLTNTVVPTALPNGTIVTPVSATPTPAPNGTNDSNNSTATTSPVTPVPTTSIATVQCPFIFSSAILSTQVDVSPDTSSGSGSGNNSSGNSTNNVVTVLPTTVVPNANNGTTMPSSITKAPGASTVHPSTNPIASTPTPTISTFTPTSTATPLLRRRLASSGFTCDAAFYGKWITNGLKCGGQDLDVHKAVAAAACATYKGEVPLSGVTVEACLSTCLFPSCTNDQWDYSSGSGKSGIGSSIYKNVDFSQWLTPAMKTQLNTKTQGAVTLQQLTMTVSNACSSFDSCTCPTVQSSNTPTNKNGQTPSSEANTGLISNWNPVTQVEKAAVATASATQTTVYASIAVSATTAVASSVGVVSTSTAGAATAGAGATGMINIINMAQFAVCTSQLNIDDMPQIITSMGAKLSFSTFSFFVWDGAKPTTKSNSARRLVDVTGDNSMTGMERYALAIGIAPNKLLYVTIVGLLLLVAAVAVLLGLVLLGGKIFCKNFSVFRVKMVDHAIGALVLIMIVAQYAIGVTAVFEINRVYRDHESIGVSVFVAVLSLIVFAVGIMVYGYYVVRQHEDEIVDNGMKDHFEKKVHRRYGCLYDEYNYENRFFFVVKMLMALLCGMTTGMANWTGLTQVCVLVALNVFFVLFLEVRQPHLAKFVQQTTTLITIMKIASLSLTIFLLTALVNLPESARNVVSIVILSLQGLVVLFLLVRQVFIFYRQWKLKQSPEEEERPGSITTYYNQTRPTPPQGSDNKIDGGNRQGRLQPLYGNRQQSFEAGKEYYL